MLVESAAVISPSEDQITRRTSVLYDLFIPLSNLLDTKQKCRLVQMERICRRFNLTEMSDLTFNIVKERKISECSSLVVSWNFGIVNCRFDQLILSEFIDVTNKLIL